MPELPDQQQAPEAPAEGETDFAAAFKERLAGDKQPDGEAPSEPKPAPAGLDEAPAQAAASGSTSGFDPWGGLTPEQKSYFERVQQSERSQRGRIGALTKKLQGVERAAPAPQAQAQEGEPPQDDDYAKSLEEYGDVIGPTAKKLAALEAKLESFQRPAADKAEVDADAEVLNEAYGALEREHPDYAQVASDQNFARWLEAQPEKVVAFASSFDPSEVSLVLTKFKADRSAAIAASSGNGSDQGTHDGTATDDKRRRQLEGSRAITPRGAPAAAGVPDDFSSAFKARVAALSG